MPAAVCVAATDAGGSPAEDGGVDLDGGLGGDGGVGSDAAGGPVQGTRVFHHYLADGGIVDVKVALSSDSLRFWRLNGTQFEQVPATYGLGTFTALVPPGETYYVQLDDTIIATDARVLDLSENKLGRPSLEDAGAGAGYIRLTLENLRPWSGHSLRLEYATNDSPIHLLAVNEPDAGMTAMTGELFHFIRAPVIGSDYGDSAVLVQFSTTHLDAGVSVGRVVRSLAVNQPIAVDPNLVTSISGVMQDPATRNVPMSVRMNEFSEMKSLIHPKAAALMLQVELKVTPVAHGAGLFGGMSPTFSMNHLGMGLATLSETVQVPGPIASWSEFAELRARYGVPVQLPPSKEGSILVSAYRRDSVAGLLGGLVQPSMRPPTDIEVEGADGWDPAVTHLSTTTPLLEWSASPTSAPDGFVVEVLEIHSAGVSTRASVIARIICSQPFIRIPPETIKSGGHYAFTITSFKREGAFDASKAPLLPWTYEDSAAAATSVFLVQ